MTSSEPSPARRRWALDISPLREHPAYLRMWSGGVISGVGAQLTMVAVGVHIYEITGSTFAVSLVGIIAFAPMIIVGLFGSNLVDAFDRRAVLIWAASLSWLTAAGIAALAWAGVPSLVPLYALTTLSAVSSTLVGTARFAILPRLVPRHQLPAAAALSGISAGLQVTIGPALAGLLIAGVGYALTYSIDVVLYTFAFLGIVTLPAIPPSNGTRISLGPRSVIEGVSYLARHPALRGSYVLHLVSMVFGRPQVLFPAIAVTVIGGGPLIVGILSSSAAIGVLASSFLSGRLVGVTKHGIAVTWAAIVFGLAVLVFGGVLAIAGSRDSEGLNVTGLVILCVLLLCTGVADNVASIFRTTMMQSEAPDGVRGRIQGLTTVVLTAGPRMGDAFMGTLSLAALWVGPVIGGSVIALYASGVLRLGSGLRGYDSREGQQ